MTVENPFIAKARLLSLRRYLPISQNQPSRGESYIPENYFFSSLPADTPFTRLSANLAESMKMMAEIESIRKSLPGIDCGACGAPTCRAFAEDLVRGTSEKRSCVVLMRECVLKKLGIMEAAELESAGRPSDLDEIIGGKDSGKPTNDQV